MSSSSLRQPLPLYSRLRELIAAGPLNKAEGREWLGWLDGQTRQGLSAVELDFAGLRDALLPEVRYQRADLLARVAHLASDVEVRLRQEEMPTAFALEPAGRPWPELQRLALGSAHEPLPMLTHRHAAFDFNLVRFWRQDMLGQHDVWMVLDKNGRAWHSPRLPRRTRPCFRYFEEAESWCRAMARQLIPAPRGKRAHKVSFPAIRLLGGEQYREWLVTLPHFSFNPAYRPEAHFPEPHLLMHLRTSVYTVGDRRLLLVEELQSDYNQAIQRAEQRTGKPVADNPFQRSWVELGLRIAVLVAARQGLDGVAVSSGVMHDLIYLERNEGRARFYDVRVATALEKLARSLGAMTNRVSLSATTQHYFAQEIAQEGLHGDRRRFWQLDSDFGPGPLPALFDSYQEAEAFRQKTVERTATVTVPVVWLTGPQRQAILAAGLPVLGAITAPWPAASLQDGQALAGGAVR